MTLTLGPDLLFADDCGFAAVDGSRSHSRRYAPQERRLVARHYWYCAWLLLLLHYVLLDCIVPVFGFALCQSVPPSANACRCSRAADVCFSFDHALSRGLLASDNTSVPCCLVHAAIEIATGHAPLAGLVSFPAIASAIINDPPPEIKKARCCTARPFFANHSYGFRILPSGFGSLPVLSLTIPWCAGPLPCVSAESPS